MSDELEKPSTKAQRKNPRKIVQIVISSVQVGQVSRPVLFALSSDGKVFEDSFVESGTHRADGSKQMIRYWRELPSLPLTEEQAVEQYPGITTGIQERTL